MGTKLSRQPAQLKTKFLSFGLQYKRLVESNELMSHESKYPGVWADLFARLLAFAMLGIGALCLILISWKFLQR